MSGRSGRRGSGDERKMETLIDPDGQEFETGDLATVNSLLCQGYRLKDGSKTYTDVVDTLAPQPVDGDSK